MHDISERWRSRTGADPDDGRLLANLVYRSKTFAGARPSMAVPITRLRRPDHALRGDTDAVIEGYPKSANGFVTHAFRWAQDPPVNVAHTTHAVGLVIAGCRAGLPALVLIRGAPEAVSRIALVRPRISLELLLKGWIGFYRPLLPWRGRFAVGRFEDVTTDLGAVIRRMNDRLGSDFAPFEHTPENERLAFQALEEDWATRIDPQEPAHEMHSGRPSAQRDRLTEEIRDKLNAPRYQGLLEEASDLHGMITAD
jgi:hypothetical protein